MKIKYCDIDEEIDESCDAEIEFDINDLNNATEEEKRKFIDEVFKEIGGE